MTILATFSTLPSNSIDIAMDAAEYAWPKTPEGAWKWIESKLSTGQITKTTYDEIKTGVTFEIETDAA